MSVGRFLLAFVAGACALWIAIFLGATFSPGYDGSGILSWDGVVYGQFSPAYLAMLYIPPVLLVLCGYLALRRPRNKNA